jgi:hypothetical protein
MSRLSLALILAASALAGPAFAGRAEYDALLARAAEARDRGELDHALHSLEMAYSMEATPKVLHEIAEVLQDLGRYREAADDFHRVLNDPLAPLKLKQEAEVSFGKLVTKLDSAWLLASIQPAERRIEFLMDGRTVSLLEEIEADAGAHVIEARLYEGRNVVLRFVNLVPGVRTKVEIDLRASKVDGVLELGPDRSKLGAIAIQGYSLHAPLAEIDSIRLEPGTYHVRTLGLERAVVLSPGQSERWVQLALPPPQEEAGSKGPNAWPLVVGGSGAVAAGVGTILMVLAKGNRDQILGAAKNSDGTITGVTMLQADKLESQASTETGVGQGLIAGGAAVALGGLLWWWWAER